ncbi:protein kinase domain-containing protein [Citrus sinensis]|uniref:Protein kinase domain-containing protein n=1 Tax=Citrus sinensis TaxID=2711 RepID=A0ACB8IR31_CITSI|nr:protein kinase domain-containing protein [Citrus sinensis]
MGRSDPDLFVLYLILFSVIVAAAANISRDQDALLSVKAHIINDNPRNILAQNWTSNTSVCSWMGITCDIYGNRVTSLTIPDLGLTGTIPSYLGNLSSLQTLVLSHNWFSGTIPKEIGNLTKLKELRLRYNKLQGEIPEELGNLAELEVLVLNNNLLTGTIPASIFNLSSISTGLDFSNNSLTGSFPDDMCEGLPRLKGLYVSYNQFKGPIPNNLWHCKGLSSASLSFNQFTGRLPRDLGNLTRLKSLYLGFNNLIGEIPEELGNLAELEMLVLTSNLLTGAIPASIFNLSSMLTALDFTNNSLTGSFPDDTCQGLPRLKGLYMSYNQFKGPIPNNLWHCKDLSTVSLSFNQFTGRIPRDLGNSTKLKSLHLGLNNLIGEIPQEIGNLRNLEILGIDQSNLVGFVPDTILNISTLKILSLFNNTFSGNLPSSKNLIGLPNLELLNLGLNNFSGSIPSFCFNASKLYALELGYNSFSGLIPEALGNLRNLKRLGLRRNYLTSSTSELMSFFSALVNCKSLKVIVLSENPLDGVLPSSIGNHSVSVEEIYMYKCNIHGRIPKEIGSLINLTTLGLGDNNLSGSLPMTLGRLKKLQGLYLQNNKFEGPIPQEFCHFSRLYEVDMNGNKLSGSIPSCLGDLNSLRILSLSSNELTSIIPSTFWNLEDILSFDFSSNSLNGSLPLEIGNLKAVVNIDLSWNRLSGNIPSTIVGLKNLQRLSLKHNKLQGPIPESFGELVSLEFLDLSNNNLSGVIPTSLEKLLYLKILNLSFNKLVGEIPRGGDFANFSAESFIGNDLLCGSPHLQVPLCRSSPHKKSRKKVILLGVVLPLSTVFIVAVILALTFGLITRCRKRRSIEVSHIKADMSPQVMWRRYSHDELLRATDQFSEKNLIGIGSYGLVYKGRFPDGIEVAIKVFHLQREGALNSFDAESEILKTIRHSNLVKTISSCTNHNFKALVLEYMPNGSLEDCLYASNFNLDIFQRLGIMIDVASALEYLHFGHSNPIVHCDIKPSNVLLDDSMVAHLSDFGIAKLLSEEDSMKQTQTLATIGYMAPEYGRKGQVSIKGDVYSYGIMLMEVFTGMKPTNELFTGEMSIKRWVNDSLPAVMNIMDANLLSEDEEHANVAKQSCASSVLSLAMECTSESPEKRIQAEVLGKSEHQLGHAIIPTPGWITLAERYKQNTGNEPSTNISRPEMSTSHRSIGGFTPAKPPASLTHFCERSSEWLEIDVSRKDAVREDNETVETITLREIANEARERVTQDRLERMEKQMETLAAILYELRDERRRDCETLVGRDEVGAEPSLRRRRVEEIPPPVDQPNGVHPHRSTGWVPGERTDEGMDQPRPGRNAEQERDQIAARDPDRAVELEGEVRRLVQVMEEIQGKRKPPSWRIMLDEESPLSTEIMGTVISRDFRFPDLKYSGRNDPLVHIECFNDMTGVQGLTPAQRAVAPEDDMMELMGMKQEEHESLRDFVKRYHRAVLDLGAFNHPQALRGLKEGVRIGRLWYNLRSPLVQNYSAGYEQARRDIEIEEEKSARIKSEQLEELKRKERRAPNGSGRAQLPRSLFPERQQEFRQMAAHPYHNTPRALNATNSRSGRPEQLQAIPARALITKPAHRRDKSRFCKFHDTHGHTIRQCRDLKIQVEDLVRNRYLDEYVNGVSPVIESQYTRDEGVERDLEREQPVIRVIAGGPTLARDSNRAWKNYERYAMTSKEVLFNLPAAKKAKVRQVPIMWTDDDEEGILYPHEDELVIKAMVAGTKLRRILVDTGSSVDILFKSALDDMGIADLKLERSNTSLKGFGGGRLTPMGIIELPIIVGTKPFERTMMLDFVVVEEKSPYQMILERAFMRISKCVMSTHFLALKYRVNGVVGVVKGDQRMVRSCYATTAKETLQVTSLDNRGDSKKGRQEPVEKLEGVVVSKSNPSRVVKVGSELGEAIKGELVKCLQSHADIFAWSHEDMPGIDRRVACHKFAIRKGARPVRQKMRCFNQERYEAINAEVEKLLKAGFIREAKYPEWISNVVLVKKANGKWRMVMPFGLKNAGATFQRLVNKVFKPLIGHTMEVYVDDMITKSREPRDHVKHLEETFELLRRYEMKLNPEKCAFRVSSGKFLGYLVSHQEIEANPEKIRAVIEMRSPRTVKEVQSLTGKLAALNQFISRATDKCHPFFQIIKKGRKMEWTSECDEAFGQPKEYLARAPLLSTPREGDQLLLYLAISKWATSLIVVMTDQPLRQMLQKPDASGRLVKWSVELSEFDLSYKPRGAVKAQALADFMVDRAERGEEIQEERAIEQGKPEGKPEGVWLVMVDGSYSEQGFGAGVVIRSLEGVEVSYAVKFEFQLTNNQAEYEAFITGLGLAHAL